MKRRPRSSPRPITAGLLRVWPLPLPNEKGGKEARGHVLVVGGSREVSGAALLAGTAALRAGAGRLQIATVKTAAPSLAVAMPEALVLGLPETVKGELAPGVPARLRKLLAAGQCVLLGPGMASADLAIDALKLLRRLDSTRAIVLDAGALRALREGRRATNETQGRLIATPHAGEMADLCGYRKSDVERHADHLATELARELNVVMVLKGKRTFIAAPDGEAFVNETAGNPGLGTSGSGDVLAGIIAGLAARGATPVQAAVWGVFLHAKAGDELARRLGPLGYLARELPGEVPRLLRILG